MIVVDIVVQLLQFLALAFLVGGLAVVVWEIAVRDPRMFRAIADDARGFAEAPPPPPEEDEGRRPTSAAPGTPERAA